jgi:hypothetical protein
LSGDEPTVTDVKTAKIEYRLQGEYKGQIATDEGEEVWGAQIIALGRNKFDLVGYRGGLPGDGWKRGDETRKASGRLVDETKIEFDLKEAVLQVTEGKLEVLVGDQVIATLPRVERTSPTLGKEPPAGATVLFDGKSIDQWTGGKLVDGQYLGATNVTSKKKLADHHLHIEFRTPFMPKSRGQGRGNSGVYVQGRYELQVLDSFGLEGENNECGGFYSISKPNVNMCLAPLSWQTYDIDFTAAKYDGDKKVTNARVTVRHNGVVIHDDLELPNGTPGNQPEGPGPESLFLQDHGNPVVFRNIWILEK